MYFHLVCSPEGFGDASGRKSTRILFRQATELMVLMDHHFVGNSTSPSLAFLSCPFHLGILLPLGKRLVGVFWDTQECEKLKSKLCANANCVYL